MARKPKGRPVNGVLVLNKPAGISSNLALQKAKRMLFAAKAGHTGALDPLATGVLPLCFGETTKFSQFLLDADKRYLSTFRLGQRTDTSDSDGQVIDTVDAAHLQESLVAAELAKFQGEIDQVPSMFSALKKDGQPLYKLARQGIEVERKSRRVTVYEVKLLAFRPGPVAEADVEVFCSKGTYIRSIAEDLGQALAVGGHVSRLHRSQAGPFTDAQSVTLEQLESLRGEGEPDLLDQLLLPVDAPVENLAKLLLPEASAHYFMMGQAVMDAQVFALGDEGDMVRVFTETGDFLGIADITDDGRVSPRRLIATLSGG